jgi:HAD superfamily hydrolase (TIGR01456 family)
MMMYDSHDWGRDIQITCDLLRSQNGHLGSLYDFKSSTAVKGKPHPQQLPLYFSNGDFLWSNDFPLTRYAQGAYHISLEHLYLKLTGHTLKYTKFGKPMRVQYEFAHSKLQEQAKKLWPTEQNHLEAVYGVGDNPASDIEGANQYGWGSVLVKTGVFDGRDEHSARHLVDHVEDGVDLVLKKYGI